MKQWIAKNQRLTVLLVVLVVVIAAKILQMQTAKPVILHHHHGDRLHKIELDSFQNSAAQSREEILQKPYVLLEFFALSCHYCKKSIPALNQLNAHPSLSVVGYVQTDKREALAYAKRHDVSYTLCKTSKHYLETFKPARVPVSYLVDTRTLEVKARFMGEVKRDEVLATIQ